MKHQHDPLSQQLVDTHAHTHTHPNPSKTRAGTCPLLWKSRQTECSAVTARADGPPAGRAVAASHQYVSYC